MTVAVWHYFRRAIENKPQQYCRCRKSIRFHTSHLLSDTPHRLHGLLAVAPVFRVALPSDVQATHHFHPLSISESIHQAMLSNHGSRLHAPF